MFRSDYVDFYIAGFMLLILILAIALVGCCGSKQELPVWHPDYQTTYTEPYRSGAIGPALDTMQSPIPLTDRVFNETGIQCVFASTEMIARWAKCGPLIDPPLTSRSDCKSYSGPQDLANKLEKYGLSRYREDVEGPMYEQSYRSKEEGIRLIKKAMREKRGCLFGVPGHAMVLIHYDEVKREVFYVDNSDEDLAIQRMDLDRFEKVWDTWVCVIYADPDWLPERATNPIWKQWAEDEKMQ